MNLFRVFGSNCMFLLFFSFLEDAYGHPGFLPFKPSNELIKAPLDMQLLFSLDVNFTGLNQVHISLALT